MGAETRRRSDHWSAKAGRSCDFSKKWLIVSTLYGIEALVFGGMTV